MPKTSLLPAALGNWEPSAITDHHDLAFFKYIREAAQGETDEGGKPLQIANRLVVFPGMELTLAVPCQALLLLETDFPVDLLP
jgi:chromosome segregation protein